MAFNYGNTVAPVVNPISRLPRQRRKLVAVGAGGCGKTSLLMVYARNNFPTEYVPTVFENFVSELVLDKKAVDLALWDTAGQEDYDRLRPLSYPDTDVVLLCFSVVDRESFRAILTKWLPEVEHFCEGVPKILVGLKKDLRPELGEDGTYAEYAEKYVTTEEAQELAYRLQARYVECSAKYRENVSSVFEIAVRSTWEQERRQSSRRRKLAFKRAFKRCSLM